MKTKAPLGEMSEKALISVASKILKDGNWTAQKRFYYDPKNKRKFYKMTPSLANFVSSLVAGGIVVLGIGIALVVISKTDRVTRA